MREPGHSQVTVPKVRREDRFPGRFHDGPGRVCGGFDGVRAEEPGFPGVDARGRGAGARRQRDLSDR